MKHRTVQHPPIFNHPLASQGLKDSLKVLLPAQTRREQRIVARLTTAYENFAKTAPAALREDLDALYAKSEALALGVVFGTLEILAELIELRVTRLASKQGTSTGKPMAPGLRKQCLGGRVNAYVNLKASSMTERERLGNAGEILTQLDLSPPSGSGVCGRAEAGSPPSVLRSSGGGTTDRIGTQRIPGEVATCSTEAEEQRRLRCSSSSVISQSDPTP